MPVKIHKNNGKFETFEIIHKFVNDFGQIKQKNEKYYRWIIIHIIECQPCYDTNPR